MVFRTQAKFIQSLAFFSVMSFGALMPVASAQTYTFEVRHQHWRGGAMGTLRITPDEVSFEEHGKKGKEHSRIWHYEEIQQLTIARSEIRILTYEDSKWKLGRDREYTFDSVPAESSTQAYRLLSGKLDQRFIAALVDEDVLADWRIPAKLDDGLSGKVGALLFCKDRIVFDAGKRGDSRTWRLSDIENISRTGPLDLSFTTAEKSGLFRGGMRQFHFQLQQALPEDRYYAVWRRLNQSKGLTFLDPEAWGR